MSDAAKPVATWRKVVAAILDFLTIFFLGGYAIGSVTGDTTETGFSLNGIPALVLFAVVIAYFVIGHKYAGGTIWAADPRRPLSPFSQKKNARRGGRSAGVSQVERGATWEDGLRFRLDRSAGGALRANLN